MFRFYRILVFLGLPLLCSCGQATGEPKFRSYELDVKHPSKFSTFVAVSPGARGEKLPGLRELETRDFNRYLRDLIGCTVAPEQETFVVGNSKDPAGYMVPIRCVN